MSKVLICDDSPAEVANLQSILTAAGHHTVTATSGTEAVAKAAAEMPALILMDIVMPDMDGYEACRRLQADPATRPIPVVFVSSKNQRADHIWATMQGARMLISKPYTEQQIAKVLSALG
jgi:twitching motility two-component system response regulator PilH